jgi:hypothetical protein
MPDPSSDIQSKLARAIRALLIADGAGSTEDTIAAPSDQERSLPLTAISVGDGDPFDGPGNLKFPVTLDLRDEAVTQPDETSDQATRRAANERLTNIVNALTKSDDDHTLYYTAARLTTLGRALAVDETSGGDANAAQRALDNADMADFTVLWWESMGVGSPGKVSGDGVSFWQRDLQFSCVACSAIL